MRQDRLRLAMEQIEAMGPQSLTLCAPRRLALEPVMMIRESMMGSMYELCMEMGRSECDYAYAETALKFSGNPDVRKHSDDALRVAYAFMRHHARKAPIYTVSEPLHQLLEDTGVKGNVPARYFAAPAKTCYIEFQAPEHRAQSPFITYADGHPSICEGCYVQENLFDDVSGLSREFREGLELDPKKPARMLFVGFTASPVNSSQPGVYNDVVDYLSLFIQDEEESLDSLFERHIRFFSGWAGKVSALKTPEQTKAFTDNYQRNLYHLAKVMFYLNVERRQQVVMNEASELEKRLEAVAPKKRRKLEQQLSRTYDRIIVGPKQYQPIKDRLVSGNLPKGTKRPHYRSGYFGIRHVGTGQAKMATLVRVSESLVNEHLLGGKQVESKSYEIR